jgi:HlyD family secretion protein
MAGDKLFRQAVLDRLASPEQLNTVMRVSDAKGWLALAGCALLLATGVVWGFLGRVPTKVNASGILLHKAGLADVAALSSGQITAIEVDVGDHVQEGQVIARIAQPELIKQLDSLRKQKAELAAAFEKSKNLGTQDVQMRASVSASERAGLRATIGSIEQRRGELAERLTTQQELYKKGLVTNDSLLATREQLRAADSQVAQMRSDMQRVSAESFSAKRINETSTQADEIRIKELEREAELLEQRITQSTSVVSTHAGRVVEVRLSVGDLIDPGIPILSLERTGEHGGLEALLYIDSREGKRIKAGMEVQLSPSVVRREKHGVLIGTVLAVEDYPSTRRGMMRVLRNEQLVETFLAATQGAPIAVRATLRPDASTKTGYRWSSGKGPDLELTSGTRTDADITTRSQPPIALLFPTFEAEH